MDSQRTQGHGTLDISALKKVYHGTGGDIEAVRNLTFTVRPGELICIVGPSGAGKTTLLRCIAGLLGPTSGTLTLSGVPITEPPRGMAVVFQEYGRSLFPWLTVSQNVGLPLKDKRLTKSERRLLVIDALDAVGLAEAGELYPWQLSGGMQQRVAIARAVAYEPEVLLMDEPFAAVDAQTRADLEDLVRSLWQRLRVTVIFVTHDIEESIYLGQRVLVLSGRPTEILEDVAIDLPAERSQLETRSSKRFAELRTHVYSLVQRAKRGERPAGPADAGSGSAPKIVEEEAPLWNA